MKIQTHRKGLNLSSMWVAALGLVIIAIVAMVGAKILGQAQANETSGSYAYNITDQGLTGINQLATWLPIVALVVAGVVIIGLLIRGFGGLSRE